jgi:Tfp pilus assembly protein PilF
VELLVTGGAGYIGGVLLFADDLQGRQETTALFMLAQAELGLGNTAEASALVEEVLDRDPNHALAADLRSTLP